MMTAGSTKVRSPIRIPILGHFLKALAYGIALPGTLFLLYLLFLTPAGWTAVSVLGVFSLLGIVTRNFPGGGFFGCLQKHKTWSWIVGVLPLGMLIIGSFNLLPKTEHFFLLWGSLGIGTLLLGIGSSLSGKDANEVLRNNSRPPIVYLRAFGQDGKGWHTTILANEENLAKVCEPFGPLVAIGRPGEWWRTPGAARLYVGDDEWQEKVTEFVADSAVVIIAVGGRNTAGLKWEIQHVIGQLQPERILILVCRPNWADSNRNEFERIYAEFRDAVNAEVFEVSQGKGGGMPELHGGALFISFDQAWRPKLWSQWRLRGWPLLLAMRKRGAYFFMREVLASSWKARNLPPPRIPFINLGEVCMILFLLVMSYFYIIMFYLESLAPDLTFTVSTAVRYIFRGMW